MARSISKQADGHTREQKLKRISLHNCVLIPWVFYIVALNKNEMRCQCKYFCMSKKDFLFHFKGSLE